MLDHFVSKNATAHKVNSYKLIILLNKPHFNLLYAN